MIRHPVQLSVNYVQAVLLEDALKMKQAALRQDLADTYDIAPRKEILEQLDEVRKLLNNAQAARRRLQEGEDKRLVRRLVGESLLNEVT